MGCYYFLNKNTDEIFSDIINNFYENENDLKNDIIKILLRHDIETRKKIFPNLKDSDLTDEHLIKQIKLFDAESFAQMDFNKPFNIIKHEVPENIDSIKVLNNLKGKMKFLTTLKEIKTIKELESISEFKYKVIPKGNAIKVDLAKANYKLFLSNKFIGFGAENTSTKLYETQLKEQGFPVNVDDYEFGDVVFVSINGNVSDENLKKTYDLCKKALDNGALLLVDSEYYLGKSSYNKGEKRLAKLFQYYTTNAFIAKQTTPIKSDNNILKKIGIIFSSFYFLKEQISKSNEFIKTRDEGVVSESKEQESTTTTNEEPASITIETAIETPIKKEKKDNAKEYTQLTIDTLIDNLEAIRVNQRRYGLKQLDNDYYVRTSEFWETYSNVSKNDSNIGVFIVDTTKDNNIKNEIQKSYDEKNISDPIPQYVIVLKQKDSPIYYRVNDDILFVDIPENIVNQITILYEYNDGSVERNNDFNILEIATYTNIVDDNVIIRPILINTSDYNDYNKHINKLYKLKDEERILLHNRYATIPKIKKETIINKLSPLFSFAIFNSIIRDFINLELNVANVKIFNNDVELETISDLLIDAQYNLYDYTIYNDDDSFNKYRNNYMQILNSIPSSIMDVITNAYDNDMQLYKLVEASTYFTLYYFNEYLKEKEIKNELSKDTEFALEYFGDSNLLELFYSDIKSFLLKDKRSEQEKEMDKIKEDALVGDNNNTVIDVSDELDTTEEFTDNPEAFEAMMTNGIPLITKMLILSLPNVNTKQLFTYYSGYVSMISHIHSIDNMPFDEAIKFIYNQMIANTINNIPQTENQSNINNISKLLLTYRFFTDSKRVKSSNMVNEFIYDMQLKYNYTAKSNILEFDTYEHAVKMAEGKLINTSKKDVVINKIKESAQLGDKIVNGNSIKKNTANMVFDELLHILYTIDIYDNDHNIKPNLFKEAASKLLNIYNGYNRDEKAKWKLYYDNMIEVIFDDGEYVVDGKKKTRKIINKDFYNDAFYSVINDIVESSRDLEKRKSNPFYINKYINHNEATKDDILNAIYIAITNLRNLGFTFNIKTLEVFDIYTSSGLNIKGIISFFDSYANIIKTIFGEAYYNTLRDKEKATGGLKYAITAVNIKLYDAIKDIISIESNIVSYYDSTLKENTFQKMFSKLPASNSIHVSTHIINEYLSSGTTNNDSDGALLENLLDSDINDNKILSHARKRNLKLNVSRLLLVKNPNNIKIEYKDVKDMQRLLINLSMFSRYGLMEFPKFGVKNISHQLIFANSNLPTFGNNRSHGPLFAYLENHKLLESDKFLKPEIEYFTKKGLPNTTFGIYRDIINSGRFAPIALKYFTSYFIKAYVLPRLISNHIRNAILANAIKINIENGKLKNEIIDLSILEKAINFEAVKAFLSNETNQNEVDNIIKKLNTIVKNQVELINNKLADDGNYSITNIKSIIKNIKIRNISFKEEEDYKADYFHALDINTKNNIYTMYAKYSKTLINKDAIDKYIKGLMFNKKVHKNELYNNAKLLGVDIYEAYDLKNYDYDEYQELSEDVEDILDSFSEYVYGLNMFYNSANLLYQNDSWIFYGDPLSYNLQIGDILKRLASFVSNGSKLSMSEQVTRIINKQYKIREEHDAYLSPITTNNKLNFGIIDDIYVELKDGFLSDVMDKYIEVLKERNKEYANEVEKVKNQLDKAEIKKGGIETTNGVGFVSFPVYRELMKRFVKWSPLHEYFYNKLLNNEPLTNTDIATVVDNSIVLFPPIKLQYSGTDGSNYTYEASNHKYAIFPIIPQLFGNDPFLTSIQDYMLKNNYHYLIAKSANKISLPTVVGVENASSKLLKYENGQYQLNETKLDHRGILDIRFLKLNSSYTNYVKENIKLNKKMLTFSFNLLERSLSDASNVEIINKIFKDLGRINENEEEKFNNEYVYKNFKKFIKNFVEAKLQMQDELFVKFNEQYSLGDKDINKFFDKIFDEMEINQDEKLSIIKEFSKLLNEYNTTDYSAVSSINLASITKIFNSLFNKYYDTMLRPLFPGNFNVATPAFIVHNRMLNAVNLTESQYDVARVTHKNANYTINKESNTPIITFKKYHKNDIITVNTNDGKKEVRVIESEKYEPKKHDPILDDEKKSAIGKLSQSKSEIYITTVVYSDKQRFLEEGVYSDFAKERAIEPNHYILDNRIYAYYNKTLELINDINEIEIVESLNNTIKLLYTTTGLDFDTPINYVDFTLNTKYDNKKSLYYEFTKDGNITIDVNINTKIDKEEFNELVSAIIIHNIGIYNKVLFNKLSEEYKKDEGVETNDINAIKYGMIRKLSKYIEKNNYEKNWVRIITEIIKKVVNAIIDNVKDRYMQMFKKDILQSINKNQQKEINYKTLPVKTTLDLLGTLVSNNLIRLNTLKYLNDVVDVRYNTNETNELKLRPTPFSTTFTRQHNILLYYISPIDGKIIQTIDRLNDILTYNINNKEKYDEIKNRIDKFINDIIIPNYSTVCNRTPLQEKSFISFHYPAYFIHPLYSTSIVEPSIEIYKMDSDFDNDKMNILHKVNVIEYVVNKEMLNKINKKERMELLAIVAKLNKKMSSKKEVKYDHILFTNNETRILNKYTPKGLIKIVTKEDDTFKHTNKQIQAFMDAYSIPHNYIAMHNLILNKENKSKLVIDDDAIKRSKNMHSLMSLNNSVDLHTVTRRIEAAIGFAVYSQYPYVYMENNKVRLNNNIISKLGLGIHGNDINEVVFNDDYISKLTSLIISGTVDYVKDDWLTFASSVLNGKAFSVFTFLIQYHFNAYKSLYYKDGKYTVDEVLIQQKFINDPDGLYKIINLFKRHKNAYRNLMYNSDQNKLALNSNLKSSPFLYNLQELLKTDKIAKEKFVGFLNNFLDIDSKSKIMPKKQRIALMALMGKLKQKKYERYKDEYKARSALLVLLKYIDKIIPSNINNETITKINNALNLDREFHLLLKLNEELYEDMFSKLGDVLRGSAEKAFIEILKMENEVDVNNMEEDYDRESFNEKLIDIEYTNYDKQLIYTPTQQPYISIINRMNKNFDLLSAYTYLNSSSLHVGLNEIKQLYNLSVNLDKIIETEPLSKSDKQYDILNKLLAKSVINKIDSITYTEDDTNKNNTSLMSIYYLNGDIKDRILSRIKNIYNALSQKSNTFNGQLFPEMFNKYLIANGINNHDFNSILINTVIDPNFSYAGYYLKFLMETQFKDSPFNKYFDIQDKNIIGIVGLQVVQKENVVMNVASYNEVKDSLINIYKSLSDEMKEVFLMSLMSLEISSSLQEFSNVIPTYIRMDYYKDISTSSIEIFNSIVSEYKTDTKNSEISYSDRPIYNLSKYVKIKKGNVKLMSSASYYLLEKISDNKNIIYSNSGLIIADDKKDNYDNDFSDYIKLLLFDNNVKIMDFNSILRPLLEYIKSSNTNTVLPKSILEEAFDMDKVSKYINGDIAFDKKASSLLKEMYKENEILLEKAISLYFMLNKMFKFANDITHLLYLSNEIEEIKIKAC